MSLGTEISRPGKMSAAAEKEKPTIEAIYFGDLEKIEENFSIKYATGALKCSFCNKPLNVAGIHSIEKHDNKLIWCCQQYECVLKSSD